MITLLRVCHSLQFPVFDNLPITQAYIYVNGAEKVKIMIYEQTLLCERTTSLLTFESDDMMKDYSHLEASSVESSLRTGI